MSTSGLSTLTAKNATLSLPTYCWRTVSAMGKLCRQGSHHVAQNFSTVTLPAIDSGVIGFPSRSTNRKSGTFLPNSWAGSGSTKNFTRLASGGTSNAKAVGSTSPPSRAPSKSATSVIDSMGPLVASCRRSPSVGKAIRRRTYDSLSIQKTRVPASRRLSTR